VLSLDLLDPNCVWSGPVSDRAHTEVSPSLPRLAVQSYYRGLLWWTIGIMSPLIIFSIVMSALGTDGPFLINDGLRICYLGLASDYALFVFLFSYLLAGLVSTSSLILLI